MPLLDLSRATRLNSVSFRCVTQKIQWITAALQTARSEVLQHITIRSDATPKGRLDEAALLELEDLDRLLVQLWTSHAIRPRGTYGVWKRGSGLKDDEPSLLPELTREGIVGPVRCATVVPGMWLARV